MYPDAFVRCGPADGERTVVGDPVVVVEVLSPTTQQADLTRKRWAYQAIDTLQAILFIAPTSHASSSPRAGRTALGSPGSSSGWRAKCRSAP